MKSSYIIRAQKFIKSIAPYIAGYETVKEIRYGVDRFLFDHPNRIINVCSGISRVVLITADYVVKIDYHTHNHCFGDCESELEHYAQACEAGFGEYFAEITKFTYDGRDFYIMPRIGNIDEDDEDVYYHCPDDLNDWLYDNLCDMHSGNYGWKDGHVVIFDYAASA